MQREHASGFPCQDSLCDQLLAFVLHRDILQCAALFNAGGKRMSSLIDQDCHGVRSSIADDESGLVACCEL